MQANSIRNGLVIVFAFVVAIWLGITIVTEQTETILRIAAAALLLTCIFLGRKIWLLFIFFHALSVPLIRGFSTAELGQVILVGFTFAIILMRRQPLNFKFTELEFLLLLVACTIGQVYIRNPVGLNIFGAGAVGAKPYFVVGLAFMASVALGNIVVPHREIKWAMWLTILGWFTSPFLYKARGMLFGGGGGGGGFEQGKFDSGQDSTRNSAFGSLALFGGKTLAAFRSPLRDCFHPIWGSLIFITLLLAAASGYRNNVAAVGMFYLIAIAYRGGFPSIVISCFLGALALTVLALTNLAFPLPPNVQRALSPFPGTWEKRHVDAAEASTEWRVDMWKEALFTDYWINNKLLGDGLGLNRREYQILLAMEEGGSALEMGSGMSAQQEAMMITGGYHSGPVQCVRTTGYVGLAILVFTMFRVAVHAHRQILRCRGTEWYPLALFFGIPIIALPFLYVFVFGDFGRDVSATFLAIGMIRLLEKNLPLPAYVIRKREPFILMNQRNQAARVADGRF
jgi:hypothetical protein